MAIFDGRAQKDAPRFLTNLLALVPEDFVSDGCTNSMDAVFGFDFSLACLVHDWKYCSRAHSPGFMNWADKKLSDRYLRQGIRGMVPLVWYPLFWLSWIKIPLCLGLWLPRVYWLGVLAFGGFGSYNSCGYGVGEKCRHNMERPKWMKETDV